MRCVQHTFGGVSTAMWMIQRARLTCLQVIAELDRSPFSELRSYTATDITPAFGPNLLQLVNNSKLEFKVDPPTTLSSCLLPGVLYVSDFKSGTHP